MVKLGWIKGSRIYTVYLQTPPEKVRRKGGAERTLGLKWKKASRGF